MSAIYMSQLSTALPLMEGDHHFQAFTLPKDPPIVPFPFVISRSSSASDSSSLSYGSSAAGAHHHHLMMRQHHQASMLDPPQLMIGGSSSPATANSVVFATTAPFPTVDSIRDDMIEPSPYDPYDMGKLQVSGGSWTTPPAKMRITRKAASSADPAGVAPPKKPRRKAQGYQVQDTAGMSSQQAGLGVIRVCSDCSTTKTPLWRSGPRGPKSLCNACGIRQRKARRAMMASAAAVSTEGGAKAAMATAAPKVKKEKRPAEVDRSLPFKKRCKVAQQDQAPVPVGAAATAAAAEVSDDAGGLSRNLVDNIGLISWRRSSAVPPAAAAAACSSSSSFRPLPAVQQDEITDAAMLLMTLSCGLVRS